jgi:hypothetical protein
MTDPITPPPELVQRLCDAAFLRGADGVSRGEIEVWLIQEAFAAGADQELEACIEWFDSQSLVYHRDLEEELRAARRPEPPTLNSIALQMLGTIEQSEHFIPEITDTIRRALEALPND